MSIEERERTESESGDGGSAEADAAPVEAEVERRLPFGELALLEELVTRDQLNELLFLQADKRDRAERTQKIGTLLVRQGFVTKDQAKRILKIQRTGGPIEGYTLAQHLGTGGMGAVFRAIEDASGREVALKILPPSATQNDRFRARFLREAQVTHKLAHEHLVRSFAQGESEGHLYFAMEFVPGTTARELLKREGAFAEPRAIAMMRQLLGGMAHYWASRVVHRDIKPENILVTPDGTAKLTDLGLCRELDDDTHLTRAGKTLGTPLYISPELARGLSDIDIRSDLYSLGACFYHLATGVPPFEAASQAEMLKDHVETKPIPPRVRNPRLSAGLDEVLLRLLQKSPDRRPADPEAVLEALDRLEAGEEPFDAPLPPEEISESVSHGFSDSLSFDVSGSNLTEGADSAEISGSAFVSDSRLEGAFTESAPPSDSGAVEEDSDPDPATRPGSGRRAGATSSPAHQSARRRATYRVGSSAQRSGWRRRQQSLPPAVSIVGFVALFAFGVFLGVRARTPAAAASRDAPPGATDARRAAAQQPGDPLAALAEAEEFAVRYPDDLLGQLRRWAVAAQRLEGTPAGEEARAGLERVRRRVEERAFEDLEAVRADAIELVEAGRPDEARRRLEAFRAAYRPVQAWQDFEELARELDGLGASPPR